ncbi:MAG TPA: hypothetical protein VE422_29805 [Terriglobia bacterium]|nr:hypothetical protein [Terriglobia bacterium]
MMQEIARTLVLLAFAGVIPASAQGIRSHTRPAASTTVDEKQAVDLTLTLTKTAVRPVQTWVRMAGRIDKSGKILTGYVRGPDADVIKVGQRVRAFPPESKSSMYQAWVTRVVPQQGRAMVEVTLASSGRQGSTSYVMEVVVIRGEFLSVPNEAIIEEGDKRVVYLQHHPGMYVPQEIHTGIQGELYTQVLQGLNDGDQVVTFGSFFIDSEYKLKSGGQPASGNEHQHHH